MNFRKQALVLTMIGTLIYPICAQTNAGEQKDKNTLILLVLSFAFGLSAVYLFWDALKDNKAYYTVGFMKSAVILFVTIISILFYNEKITTAEICGILFIITGIILLNSYKSY